ITSGHLFDYVFIHTSMRAHFFPYTTLFRSELLVGLARGGVALADLRLPAAAEPGLPGLSRWSADAGSGPDADTQPALAARRPARSEEHTSELQSREKLVCRLLLEKKKTKCT